MKGRHGLRGLAAIAAALAGLVATAVVAQDADVPSPERGLAFAQRFCKECHLVEGSGTTAVPAGIPTLRGIANRADQTGDRIRNVLINPHPPMPDMQVSSQEILDLLAYLETLRTTKGGAPFLTPAEKTPKPKYPKPS